jgi:histidinol-phosphate aminotransferase
MAALRALAETDVSSYPDYDEVHARVATWFGVPGDQLVLTNGMDEGILAAAVAQLQNSGSGAGALSPDVVIPLPAFDEYEASSLAVGGRVVTVPPSRDLSCALDAVLNAITPRTRLAYLANPGNPSGLLLPHETVRAIAKRLEPNGLVFLDEAYVDFADDGPGASYLGELATSPNVVIGRTFSKAYGLAALRIGALIGAPAALAPLARIVPPFSLNVFATTGVTAALADTAYLDRYRSEVVRSRALLYEMCQRLGLPFWRSQANFVLIRAGAHADAIVDGLRARGIHIRNVSRQPGCEACIRITAGVLAHTEACVDAMEDVLCEKPR